MKRITRIERYIICQQKTATIETQVCVFK